MTRPNLSVVLPTHNGAHYIDQSISSIVAQTYEDWELLVVDDASTDESAQKIQAWVEKDERIRAISLQRNHQLPAALNAGFRLARGSYFSWTSDDNWYRPDAFASLLDAIEREPSRDIVFSSFIEVDGSGATLRERHLYWPSDLVRGNTVGPCFLYRRQVDETLGGYAEDLILAEDYDFWLRASLRFHFHAVDELLYYYRVHEGSLTAQRTEAVEAIAQHALDRHLAELSCRERGDALVRLAAVDLSQGITKRGRRRLGQAIALGRWPLLHSGFRLVLLDLLLGPRIGSWLRRLHGRLFASPDTPTLGESS
jgi:glycosyltransferase involved in cell wall biosynthesis